MTDTLQFDNSASQRLLSAYVTPDMIEQRRKTLDYLSLKPGEKVLDVGTGPGFMAASMAEAVGTSGEVAGIDISEQMLALATAHCAHLPQASFKQANLAYLPYPDAHFDVAIVTQVLEYVVDVQQALHELKRILRPGGRLLVLDTDWDSIVWHSGDPARMQRILQAWDEHLVDPYLPRTLAGKLRRAGFEIAQREIIPIFNPSFHEDSFSNRMIDLIGAFVEGRQGISKETVDAWASELRTLESQGDYFFSLNRYVFISNKS